MSNEYSGGFETLKVWKVARSFRGAINNLVDSFAEEERYLLRYQLLKSSRLIGNAIAKGYGHHQMVDMLHSCRMARGHLLETLDNLYVALDEKYISKGTFYLLEKECNYLLKLLNGYIGYLKKKEDLDTNEFDMVMEDISVYGDADISK